MLSNTCFSWCNIPEFVVHIRIPWYILSANKDTSEASVPGSGQVELITLKILLSKSFVIFLILFFSSYSWTGFAKKSNTTDATKCIRNGLDVRSQQVLLPIVRWVLLTQYLVFCVMFWQPIFICLSIFASGHCIVCPFTISSFWLLLWYLRTVHAVMGYT